VFNYSASARSSLVTAQHPSSYRVSDANQNQKKDHQAKPLQTF